MREIELLDGRHEIARGLDSETWGELRNILIEQKVITQNDKGHYLLCQDLHAVPFWQLKEWVDKEQTLGGQDIAADSSWQGAANQLLLDERREQREILAVNLVDLFHR